VRLSRASAATLALLTFATMLAPSAYASGGFPTTVNLVSSSACVPINQSFTLTATLRNNTNLAVLPGKTIIFQYAINASSFSTLGNTSGYTTNSQGQAHLAFTAKYNGSYLFRAVFGGTSDFFNPSNNFNGSISNSVLVQTSNLCSKSSGCGFLGLGCFFANPLGGLSNIFSGAASAFGSFWNGATDAVGSGLNSAVTSIGNTLSGIGFWFNPINWLNALGLGFIWNAFLYFIDVLILFFQIVIATLPYLGFILVMIHLYYIVRFDFEGLFGFWAQVYGIVAMIADAVFNFVQIIIDMVQAVSGGTGGLGAAAAAA
jgi:hypothetical protein